MREYEVILKIDGRKYGKIIDIDATSEDDAVAKVALALLKARVISVKERSPY